MKSPNAPPPLRLRIWLSVFTAFLIFGGCGSTTETKNETSIPKDEFSRYVRENESGFHPSDYGVETWDSGGKAGSTTIPHESSEPEAATDTDTIPGFRVQVMISQEIDRANWLKDSLSLEMPGQWIYIVHHPPYYKVRIGNYADRFSAGETLDRLRRHGLGDAWVVPDRIIRNAPPAPVAPVSPDSTQPIIESMPRH